MNESTILEHLQKLDKFALDRIWSGNEVSAIMNLSMVLGAIFALILVGRVCFKAMSGQGSFDFLELGKPVIISLILSNWLLVSNGVFGIGRILENNFQSVYIHQGKVIDSLKQVRLESAVFLKKKLKDTKERSEYYQKINLQEDYKEKRTPDSGKEQGVSNAVEENLNEEPADKLDYLNTHAIIAQSYAMDKTESVLQWIAESFWNFSIYLVFLVKHIATAVLVIFGPVMMAASILPFYSDAWSRWLKKAIPVSLIGGIAYLVMFLSLLIIYYGIDADIRYIDKITVTEADFYDYIKYTANGGFGTAILYIISLFCGGGLVLLAPELATWVFPSDVFRGATEFHQGMRNGIRDAGAMVAGAVTTVVTGNPSIGASTVSSLSSNGNGTPSPFDGGSDTDTGTGNSPAATSTADSDGTTYFIKESHADKKKSAAASGKNKTPASTAPGPVDYPTDDPERYNQALDNLEELEEAIKDGRADEYFGQETVPDETAETASEDPEIHTEQTGADKYPADSDMQKLIEQELREEALEQLDEAIAEYSDTSSENKKNTTQ